MELLSKKLMVTVTNTVLVAYVSFGILGFFHVLEMTTMSMTMEDCPFVHVLHDGLESAVVNTIHMIQTPMGVYEPFFELLLCVGLFFLIRTIVVILPTNYHLYIHTHKNNRRLRQTLYQFLFSNGILNTKLF